MIMLLSLVLLAQTGSGARAASLLVNGSFEKAPATSAYLNLPGGAASIAGWVVTGEGIDLVAAGYWAASDGNHSVDLDGSRASRSTPPYAHGGIAQTFATKAGTRYLVSFDMAGNFVPKPVLKPMRVSAAGQTMDFSFDVTGKTVRQMGWLRKTWTFTARADSTTLEFQSLTVSPLTGFGPAIDNVSVTPVEESQVEVRESAKEIEVRVGAEVLFASGRYELRPAATAALQRVAEVIKQHPGLPVLIEGHTDSVGTASSNQLLSERRAKAVLEWLITRGGVPAAGATAKGYGESRPSASNASPQGRQQNRRVEIRLLKG